MKIVCPKCNSTNVRTERRPNSISNCGDCKFCAPTSKFPIGKYRVGLPSLQELIDNWCDSMSVSKEGYFYKNVSAMCPGIMGEYTKPWEDENKKLKLFVDVLEKRAGEKFVATAMRYIEDGNDILEDIVEDEEGNERIVGQLILSYQSTESKIEE